VKPGDTLWVIEVIKVFTQVECRQAGTVEAILAEGGQLVEYGQPLFRIVT
jgi:acetyl-CoA carboxylase biotin carboxyl carrier protein